MQDNNKLPKIDLHCHLDGSLSLGTINKLIKLENLEIDTNNLEEKLRVDDSCTDLAMYLQKFELPLKLLKTPKSFEIAVYDLLKEVASENMIYTEIRFAPFLSATTTKEAKEIVGSAIIGLNKAKEDFGIEANLILCCMRHQDEETNLKVLDVANEFLNKGVCAIDIAGDEARFPMSLFENIFNKAKEEHIPFTIHAGETGSFENVKQAVKFGAKRIGHGIAIMNDKEALELCLENKIGIEMCPTSNRQTRAIDDMKDYPYGYFMEKGLLVTLNTDNRTVSNTTINKEIDLLSFYGEVDYMKCLENAVEVSFASDEVKVKLREKIRRA